MGDLMGEGCQIEGIQRGREAGGAGGGVEGFTGGEGRGCSSVV